MILTEHAKMRYAQRVLGIESEEDALQYSRDNEVEVSYGLWSMYSKATMLFENYTYDVERDATGNVLIYKDIIIITSNHPQFKFITLWKSDTADTGRLETQGFIKELNINKHETQSIKKRFTKLDRDIKYIDHSLEELNKQYEFLELKRIEINKEFELSHQKRKDIKAQNRRIVRHLTHGFKV